MGCIYTYIYIYICRGCMYIHTWVVCIFIHGVYIYACMGCIYNHAWGVYICMHGMYIYACTRCIYIYICACMNLSFWMLVLQHPASLRGLTSCSFFLFSVFVVFFSVSPSFSLPLSLSIYMYIYIFSVSPLISLS